MKTKYWLVLGGMVAFGVESVACSPGDRSCMTTRTCEINGGAAQIQAQGGAAARARGGSSGTGAETSLGGEGHSVAGEGGEGGEGPNEFDGEAGARVAGSAGQGSGGSAGQGGASTAGGFGGSAGSAGNGATDTVAPTVLRITPSNGATMLTTDTDRIVITFSEPMNQGSAQAAFVPHFASPKAAFSWNTTGNELTIDPKLTYPTSIDPDAPNAPFSFDLTTVAKDLAGNSLTAGVSNWQFSLLREITQAIPYWEAYGGNVSADGVRNKSLSVGDLKTNAERRGFATYDISPVPNGVQRFLSASIETSIIAIDGDPFGSFGNLLLQSVQFGQVDASAFNAQVVRDLGTLLAATDVHEVKHFVSKDVLSAFEDDYENRVARGNLSQYRLLYASAPNQNSASDAIVFSNTMTGNTLTVKYLFP